MNKAVPWSIKGVDFDAREAAKEAARRSGMSLGEWLNSVIADQAAALGVEVDDIDESDRLEAVTARLAQMSKRPTGRTLRRDDSADAEETLRRRRPAPIRERQELRDRQEARGRPEPRESYEPRDRYQTHDDEYDREPPREYARDRAPQRDPELILNEAIRAFERGARRTGERTAAAISQVARRLDDIETHLVPQRAEVAPRAAPLSNPSHDAIAKLEARLEALSRRREPDSAESSLHDLERKIAAMSDRIEAKPKAPLAEAAPSDLNRIEDKLNRLLETIARPKAPEHAPVLSRTHAPQFARASLGDAIAQITRRQRALDGESPAPRAPAIDPAPAVPPGPDLSALQKDIATLATRLEETRRDVLDRSDTARKTALAAIPEADHLRRQIDDMSRALRDVAPRDALESVEGAIRDLGQRIDASRQVGVHETILRPIEDLASEVRRSLAHSSQHNGVEGLEREIRAMAAKVDAARVPDMDAHTLRDIQAQTQEMRDLLSRAIARPAPIETLERHIAGLSDRVERLSHVGVTATSTDNAALARSIGEIRSALDQSLSGGVFSQLESKIEQLGRKIDDAVSQSNATDQLGELAERMDNMQRSLTASPMPVAVGAPVNTSALERMMIELAGKLERPATTDTRRLEAMVQSLADRLEGAGAPQSDMRLVESLQGQIARLAEKVDAAGQSRSDGRIIEQLQAEMAQFAERIEAGQSRIDPHFTTTLQQQMSQLVGRLDQGDASARVLASLETTVGELFHRIDDIRNAAVDAAEAAARNSVIEAMQQQPTQAAIGFPAETITREIADLRAVQDTADRRTHATLTAVHETLEKVVDRLAILEDDLAEVRPESLASGPTPVFARAAQPDQPISQAPPLQAPLLNASREPEMPRARQFTPASGPSMDVGLDELIEPGSGLPNARRAAPVDAGKQTDQSTQSRLIAAARQAISAAASEPAGKPGGRNAAATVLDTALSGARDRAKAAHMAIAGASLEPQTAGEGDMPANGKLAKIKNFVVARKRLALIGLVGTVAIAGTYQGMRFLTRSPARPEIVDLTNQKISQRAAPEAAAQRLAAAKQGSDGAAPESFTQAPADLSNASKFSPGPTAKAPSEVDSLPVGSINQKPATATALNLRDAAGGGNVAAQFEIATRYAEGRTVPRDLRLATQWFEKAAQQNSAPAQYRLGSHYERGIGADRDTKKAREWYQRAAEAGNIRAMHNLAVLGAEGPDGKPDYATAASWFRKASEFGVRDSQYNLAILYARGLGIEQNLQQSWMWFSLAAGQGDEDAAKKRDDVATRLDPRGLAAAKAMYDSFKPKASEKAANEVPAPAGGWDLPAVAEPRPATNPAPSVKAPAKGKISSL